MRCVWSLVYRICVMPGDYDDMFDWAEEDVKPLFNRTELLIKKMKSLLSLVE